jgi:chaperonin GroEL (HSP60 family)
VVDAIKMTEVSGRMDLDNITIQKGSGGVVNDSLLVKGLLVDTTDPLTSSMPTTVNNAQIACIGTDLSSGSVENTISIDNPDMADEIVEFEREKSQEIIYSFENLGVNVVFSDSNIGDKVKRQLSTNGILAFKRVTPEDLENISRATDATIVSDIQEMGSEDLGTADIVDIQNISGDELVTIQGCENPKSVSFLLYGGTEHSIDEIERTVRNSLAAIRTTVLDGRILPGGGAPENHAAMRLRQRAKSISTRKQLAITAFADALETIPKTLAENMGHDSIDSIVAMRENHTNGLIKTGVTPDQGVVGDTSSIGIVDSYVAKKQAVTGAADIASRTLRIDELISADHLGDDFIDEHDRNYDSG